MQTYIMIPSSLLPVRASPEKHKRQLGRVDSTLSSAGEQVEQIKDAAKSAYNQELKRRLQSLDAYTYIYVNEPWLELETAIAIALREDPARDWKAAWNAELDDALDAHRRATRQVKAVIKAAQKAMAKQPLDGMEVEAKPIAPAQSAVFDGAKKMREQILEF